MERHVFPARITAVLLSLTMLAATACARPAATGGLASPSTPTPTPTPLRPSTGVMLDAFGRVPLHFEQNRGQAEPPVAFVARARGYRVSLARDGLTFDVPGGPIRMVLVDGAPRPHLAGVDALPGTINYLGARRAIIGIPTFARVRYEGAYPGIDLVVYGTARKVEYDFVVAPGAVPETIRLRFDNARGATLDGAGNLVLRTAAGAMIQARPVIYQDIDGARRPVDGAYVLHESGVVGFRVGDYDRRHALVIDPVIVYSTFLGGGDEELIRGIAADAAGNAYVVGNTVSGLGGSEPFPWKDGLPPASTQGGGFVAKFDPTGSTLLFASYIEAAGGGIGPHAVALDGAGNIFVAGSTTSTSFPTTAGSVQPTPAGGGDGFVMKLNPAGDTILYATYLGGAGGLDTVRAIAVDADGAAFVAGSTASTTFPVTPGAVQGTFGGGTASGFGTPSDGFVAKLTPDGGALAYATYLGGAGNDIAAGIAVDASGAAFVAGTATAGFPTTAGAFKTTLAGSDPADAFVTKLTATGALAYSTLLGGSASDHARAIDIDATGNAYVTGGTASSDFPLMNAHFAGGSEMFITKLNATGSAVVYSTYFEKGEPGVAIAVDSAGAAHVATDVETFGFPQVNGVMEAGCGDPTTPCTVVAKLNPAGQITASEYSVIVGTSTGQLTLAMTIDPASNVYVAGRAGHGHATTPGAWDTTHAQGDHDAFVVKLSPGSGGGGGGDTTKPRVAITSPSNGAWMGDGVTVKVTASDDARLVDIKVWGAGAAFATIPCDGTTCSGTTWFDTTGKPNGQYELNAVATDSAGHETVSATVKLNKHATSPVYPSGVGTGGGGGGDTTPPTVTVTQPAHGATVSGTVTASATASDDVGVASVQFMVDGANLGTPDTIAPYAVSWNTAAVPDGTHTLTAVATDAAGNATTSAPITVTVSNGTGGGGDTTAPTVAITSPSNGAWIGDGVTIKVTASDDTSLTSITLWGAGGVFATIPCSGTTCSGTTWFDTTGKPNGQYEVNAVATDAAGTQTISATVKLNKHATSPVYPSGVTAGGGGGEGGDGGAGGDTTSTTVAITAPSNGAWMGDGVTVKVTASDAGGLATIELWGAGAVFATVPCAGTTCNGTAWFDTTGKPNAQYELNAVATDSAGTTTISATVKVNKHATSPVVASGAQP